MDRWTIMAGGIVKRAKADLLAAVFLAVLMASCTPAPAPDVASEPATVEADSDELNLDLWLERMEVGSRELYSARNEVVEALGLAPGDSIADIGAGTGLYTLLFSDAVGPTGRVYAEDIEALFLELINRRADDSGVDNITAVLGRENDVTLPANLIDIVFIADTYHYFGDRETVMKSVLRALKPGGSLVVVDYDLKPGETRPDDKEYVRFGKAGVISEIEYIGFKLADDVAVEGLEENYFLRFEKPQ